MLLEEFEILCGDAGIGNPTVFERQALAYCAKYGKRDLIFKITPHDLLIPGAVILSLLVKRPSIKQSQGSSPARIVLLDESLLEQAHAFLASLLVKPRPSYRSCKVIGLNGNARDDLRHIGKLPELIVSTPRRLIDHIRRDNLSLAGVANLTVVRTIREDDEATRSFDQDVMFIHSKLSRSAAVHVFTPNLDESEDLQDLTKHPRIVERSEWHIFTNELFMYQVPRPSAEQITAVLCSRSASKAAVLVKDSSEKHIMKKVLSSQNFLKDVQVYIPEEFNTDSGGAASVCAVYGVSVPALQELLHQETGPLLQFPQIIIAGGPEHESFLQTIQEKFNMKTTKQSLPAEQEVISGKIKMLLDDVKQYKHPEELAELRRLIRKNVPFHLRSYLSAYLLRDALGEAPQRKTAQVSEDENMVTLFVSIGKNRKVYPKDLTKLFTEQGNISDSDIGSIRVLDNYSFINVSRDSAQGAIEIMDNMKFRGRNITVSFAKKKTS